MIDQINHMGAFRQSKLYQHIPFKEEGDTTMMKKMLLKGLEEDESIDFLKADGRFAELKKKMKALVL